MPGLPDRQSLRLDEAVSSSDTLGWAVLGTGHIASVVMRDLALLPDEARLVAVGSRDADRAEAFAAAHRFVRSYGSYAEAAADADVDIVYVATTADDHLTAARSALEAGKPVLIEKPLGTSPADTDALIAEAESRDLLLMEAMWTRTNPLIRKAAAIVAAGELGPVRHIGASFGFSFDGPETHRLLDPARAGGGILDLGVYPVHLVQLFLGEPAEIHAVGTIGATGVDVHAAALLSYPATTTTPAATALLSCSLSAMLPNRLEICCAEGRILVDDSVTRPAQILVYRGVDTRSEPEVMITAWSGAGYTFQLQEAMRCERAGVRESPLVPWHDSRAVARTLHRWSLAVRGGQDLGAETTQ